MMIHTPGPLTLGANGDRCARNHALCADGRVVAKVYGLGYPIGAGWSPQSEADARRLVACWNYCQHLSTLDLERSIAKGEPGSSVVHTDNSGALEVFS